MKTTVDTAGRIVIPKKIRDEVGLTPGSEVEVTARNGVIEIEPPQAKFRLEKRGHLVVVASDEDVALESFDLDVHRRQIENERMGL